MCYFLPHKCASGGTTSETLDLQTTCTIWARAHSILADICKHLQTLDKKRHTVKLWESHQGLSLNRCAIWLSLQLCHCTVNALKVRSHLCRKHASPTASWFLSFCNFAMAVIHIYYGHIMAQGGCSKRFSHASTHYIAPVLSKRLWWNAALPAGSNNTQAACGKLFFLSVLLFLLEISYLRRTWSGGFITNRRTVMAAVGAPESTTHPASAFPLCNTRNRKHERDIQYHTALSKLKLLWTRLAANQSGPTFPTTYYSTSNTKTAVEKQTVATEKPSHLRASPSVP